MTEEKKEGRWDYVLLLVALGLAAVGLMMVLSASSFVAQRRFGDAYYFFRPQVLYVLMGIGVMIVARNIPYQVFCKLAYPLLLLTLAGLVLVLIPGIGHKVGGSSRWLRPFGFSIQPSEVAKVTLVIYMAYSLANKHESIDRFWVSVFPHLVVLAVMIALVIAEPDLGSAVIMTMLVFTLFFVSGVPLKYLVSMGVLAIPLVWGLIIHSPYRLKRIVAFTSPWDDPLGTGYHIIHSFLAFASGGLFGLGPGAGRQKQMFLPEPHTDFIFSVVGEELGFVGVALVALLFLVFVWRGISVAMNALDLRGTYLALGMTLVVGFQAFLNMFVVLGLLPTKGLALPFFSYGGSAMLVNFLCLGIILNVSGQKKAPGKAKR